MTQQSGRLVQQHEVDLVAPDVAGHRGDEPPDRLLDRGGRRHAGVVDEHGDIDVAVRTRRAARPTPEQIGETDRRLGAQTAGEIIPKATGW